MKRAEIAIGETYTNDKGRFRKVTAAGPEFVLYPGQEDADCLKYEGFAETRSEILAD